MVEVSASSYTFLRMGTATQHKPVTGLSDSRAGGRDVGQGHDVQPPIPALKWVLLQGRDTGSLPARVTVLEECLWACVAGEGCCRVCGLSSESGLSGS